MAAIDPLVKLTEWISDGKESPAEKGRLMAKEQLEMYMAFDFAASKDGYGLKFLEGITKQDRLNMMALQGKRSDDIVEGMKALQIPLGMDVGGQPREILLRRKSRPSNDQSQG